MFYSRVIGLGHYVPKLTITNKKMEEITGADPSWIESRTGIKERRYAEYTKDFNYSMAIHASLMALSNAKVSKESIELVIYSTQASDTFSPSSAYIFQHKFGLKNTPILDIRGQCSGFIQALSIADQYIKSGMYKCILVVASEINSVYLDKSPNGVETTPIFGDGSGAMLLNRSSDSLNSVLSTHLHANGEYCNSLAISLPIEIKSDSHGWNNQSPTYGVISMFMDGKVVFRNACRYIPEVINEALDSNSITKDDIKYFFIHQANLRIIETVVKLMKLPFTQVYNNIEYYGNTVSASIPILLSEAWEKRLIKKNDLICLSSFGSGFNWASALIRL